MMSSLSLKIAAFSVYTSNSYTLIAQYPVYHLKHVKYNCFQKCKKYIKLTFYLKFREVSIVERQSPT